MKNRTVIYLFSMFILASVSDAKAQVNLEDGLVRHYALNGNLDDSSPSAQHATNQGAISTSRYEVDDTALETDGSTKITMPTIGNWGDTLTISYWFKADFDGNSQKHLASRSGTSGATVINLFITATSDQKIKFKVASDNTGNSEVTSSNSYVDGEWNHVVCELDVAGQGIKIILNGSETITGYPVTPRYLNLGIGIGNWAAPYDGANQGLNGKIDDVMVYDRVLTSDEVEYLGNPLHYPMGIDHGMMAYYPFSNNADDESGNNNHGAETSVVYTDDVNGSSMDAIEFDGLQPSYVNIGTGVKPEDFPFALSTWIYTDDIQTDQFVFRTDRWQSGSTYAGFNLRINEGRIGASFGDNYGSGASSRKGYWSDTLELGSGTWHHVVANYVSPTQIDFYIDTELSTDGDYMGSAGSIGYNSNASGFVGVGMNSEKAFTGKLDELRVYQRALSPENISDLFAHQTGTPTSISDRHSSVFGIYPNPTNGLVNLQHEGEAIISVFDLAGNKLMETSHNGQSVIDLSGYANGMYIVRLESETEVLTNNIILQ